MPFFPDVLALLVVIQLSLPGSLSQMSHLSPQKGCLTCNKSPGTDKKNYRTLPRSSEESTSVLALGEPCGVYTLNCAKGLRCIPPSGEPSPLQALLQGRGVCANPKATNVHTPPPTESLPLPPESSEKGPCRKQLTTLLKGLELTHFESNQDIYIPNCDKRGFFRRKQCWSSRGMQRGRCWCVDENGVKIPSRTGEDGNIICDNTRRESATAL
ncbi:insulin-like growth factor-binding protein 6a [Chanos chanos]|uniref:Insulin-like growth factor-binding protein 6a n=1 Tax=Chanos chanos TaxID=29144 RepID=A0A6J2VQS3_CHACN|nr:insulin-like growth factor-binding protein 5 [Chanos chanos]